MLMSEWQYVPEHLEDFLGFVYIIRHEESGHYYIGKKQFWRAVRRKPLKGKKRVRLDRVESDWKNYWGSSKKFLDFVEREGKDKFTRTILSCHTTKHDLAYAELMHQIECDVLEDPQSFNGIINVRLSKQKVLP
jgi:hypothetical protein